MANPPSLSYLSSFSEEHKYNEDGIDLDVPLRKGVCVVKSEDLRRYIINHMKT